MSKNVLRMLATLLVAFGMIAGSLGTAVAGVDVLNPEGDIETDGGDGGDGGNTGQQNGGGTNDNSNNQGNDQDQTQTPNQDQTVDQDNTNDLDQDNDLDAAAGGSAGGFCEIDQPDGADLLVEDEDEDAASGDVINGDDGANCTVGDSEVGDSSTGDTNQANAGEANAANDNSQNQEGGDQSNVNEPTHGNNQALVNDLDADAGDGAEGGDAENSGSIDLTNEIVVTLVRILDSILGNDNQDDITLPPVGEGGVEVPTTLNCDAVDAADGNSSNALVEADLVAVVGADVADLLDVDAVLAACTDLLVDDVDNTVDDIIDLGGLIDLDI